MNRSHRLPSVTITQQQQQQLILIALDITRVYELKIVSSQMLLWLGSPFRISKRQALDTNNMVVLHARTVLSLSNW